MTKSTVRKIDLGSELMICNQFTRHYFVSGDDNVLKVYEHFPSDSFDKIDWKKPAVRAGNDLKDSHALATTVGASSEVAKIIVTGGKDGMINIRSTEQEAGTDQYECIKSMSAHSVSCGGVIALSID